MKVLLGAFNQEKALLGAFSVIVKTKCETDGSFYSTITQVGAEAGLEDGLQAGVEAGLPGQGLQPRHPHQTRIPGTENWILQINSDPYAINYVVMGSHRKTHPCLERRGLRSVRSLTELRSK